MMAVLGILCLVLSNVFQTNTIFLYLLSTMFTYICTEEHGVKYGLLTYAVITLAGFMTVANKAGIAAYAIVAGYYPVVKHIIEHLNISKLVKWVIKLVFAVVISSVAYWILKHFIVFNISLVFAFPAGAAVFIIYDIVLTLGIMFYTLRLRNFK